MRHDNTHHKYFCSFFVYHITYLFTYYSKRLSFSRNQNAIQYTVHSSYDCITKTNDFVEFYTTIGNENKIQRNTHDHEQ